MEGIRVRGKFVPFDDKRYNSHFHQKGYHFDITKMKIFRSRFLYNVPGIQYTPTLGKTILGTKECVFKLFAQWYGNLRFCLIGTKVEQDKAIQDFQSEDDSIQVLYRIEEVEMCLETNRFESCIYLPCDGTMFETDLSEFEFDFLEEFNFKIMNAQDVNVEWLKKLFTEQHKRMTLIEEARNERD